MTVDRYKCFDVICCLPFQGVRGGHKLEITLVYMCQAVWCQRTWYCWLQPWELRISHVWYVFARHINTVHPSAFSFIYISPTSVSRRELSLIHFSNFIFCGPISIQIIVFITLDLHVITPLRPANVGLVQKSYVRNGKKQKSETKWHDAEICYKCKPMDTLNPRPAKCFLQLDADTAHISVNTRCSPLGLACIVSFVLHRAQSFDYHRAEFILFVTE